MLLGLDSPMLGVVTGGTAPGGDTAQLQIVT
jgi:hypothetical protein